MMNISFYRHEVITFLSGAGGAIVSIPYTLLSKNALNRLFYIASGMLAAYFISPDISRYFGLNMNASAFLCGAFSGSVIGKAIEIIRGLKLSDLILWWRK